MLLSGWTPAIFISLGNAGARRFISARYFGFTDWGICGRGKEYKAQSEHARTASSLFCASHHFNRRHQRRRLTAAGWPLQPFNPSLEDCPGALNSRWPLRVWTG